MPLSASAGSREKSDALVEVCEDSSATGQTTRPGSNDAPATDRIAVHIESPVRSLFGSQQDRVVAMTLDELGVTRGELHVYDEHALDFVLRARTRAAVERLRQLGGRI